MRRMRTSWPVPLICSALLRCTSFEPGTDELSVDLDEPTDQVQAELEPDGLDWSCLVQEPAEEPEDLVRAPDSNRLVASLRLLSLRTGVAVPGTVVRACAQADVNCTAPLSEFLPAAEGGWVDVPLYPGFNGYFEVRSDTALPSLVFLARPLSVETSVDTVPFGLVETDILPSLSAATGSQQDPMLGLVWLRAFDCQGLPASGVSFNIDRAAASPYYFIGDLPSSTAEATGGSGLGGFVNVQPGIAVVGAAVNDTGRALGSSRTLLVRRGWLSGVRIVPAAFPH